MKLVIASGATLAVFIIYAVCFVALDLPYGLRSTWPAFIFVFALALYLTSNPFREDDDVEEPRK
jgi:hypothetical protein